MKLFSMVATVVGLTLSAVKFQKVAEAAGDMVDAAREGADLVRAASQFALGAELLADFGARLGKVDGLKGAQADQGVAPRVAMGVDTLRMMSAYYLHAGLGERFGDFAVLQGADLQTRWSLLRESVMQNKLGRGYGEKGPGVIGISDRLACMAAGALGVAARLRAKRLSEEGGLGPVERDELVSQARLGNQDAERFARGEAMDKLAAMRSKGAGSARVSEAERLLGEKAAQAKMSGAGEVAQIQFFYGDRESALATLSSALESLSPALVKAGREALSKELKWARGNDRDFCSWVAGALGIGEPKMGAQQGAGPKASWLAGRC